MSLLSAIWRADNEEELLGRIAAWLRDETGCSEVDLYLYGPGGLNFRPGTHLNEGLSRSRSSELRHLSEQAAGTRQPVEGFCRDVPCRVLPLCGPEEMLGVVVLVYDERPVGEPSAHPADEAYRALHMFRSAADSSSSASRLSALTEVSQTISNSPYLEEILQLLVHMTAQRFGYRVVTVRLLDAKRQALVLRATQASHKAYQNKRAIRLGESIAGRVLTTGEPVIVTDVQNDPDYVGHDLAEQQ
ncbi:MAG: GAF domain-containing protein, partial [Fimbriimonadaceae bacterium]|nr:GAF domain-containing protein [Fimbriimonadaceae bacterium]